MQTFIRQLGSNKDTTGCILGNVECFWSLIHTESENILAFAVQILTILTSHESPNFMKVQY